MNFVLIFFRCIHFFFVFFHFWCLSRNSQNVKSLTNHGIIKRTHLATYKKKEQKYKKCIFVNENSKRNDNNKT